MTAPVDERPARGRVVALVGAESTGKSTLARALRDALFSAGRPADDIAVVDEYLREFCETAGRMPRPDEQAGIAAEQTRRIARAAARYALVIADTSALMTAVYHEQVFGDRGLYAAAEADHARGVDLALLTGLDLPWVADGPMRDGPQVRGPVDAKLRAALDRIGRPYAVIHGRGTARIDAALAALARLLGPPADRRPADAAGDATAPVATVPRAAPALAPVCERCGDAACERRLLPSLSAAPPTPGAAVPPA